MPELPDVEGFRRQLARRLPGRRVREVDISDSGVLRNCGARAFEQHLVGHRFRTPQRQGKWLLLPTDGPTLIVHSGMTGRPYYAAASDEVEPYERVRVVLDRGQLRYADLRKLRGLWLVDTDRELAAVIGGTGPDAMTIERSAFVDAIGRRRGRLKTTLTDQSVLAGLGNLLSDEICWQARIHPLRAGAELSDDEVRILHSTMRRVLQTSVRHACVPSLRGWLTRVRDDADAICPRCGTPLERGRNGGRATVWCPHCQPR